MNIILAVKKTVLSFSNAADTRQKHNGSFK